MPLIERVAWGQRLGKHNAAVRLGYTDDLERRGRDLGACVTNHMIGPRLYFGEMIRLPVRHGQSNNHHSEQKPDHHHFSICA